MNRSGAHGNRGIRLSLIVGTVCLFAMALFSSLGNSFLYIFGGATAFSYFLAWHLYRQAYPGDRFHRRPQSHKSIFSTIAFFDFLFRPRPHVAGRPTPLKRIVWSLVSTSFVIAAFVYFLTDSSGDESPIAEDYSSFADQGDFYYNEGNYDSARLAYRLSVSRDVESVRGYYGLANVSFSTSNFDSALFFYERVLKAQPENLDAAYGVALSHYYKEEYRASLEDLSYIFNKSNDYTNAYLLAGDDHYMLGQHELALRQYEEAYALGARSAELSRIMGELYERQGNRENARDFYQQSLTLDSTQSDLRTKLSGLE